MKRLMLKELPRYECLSEASLSYPELDPSACEVFLNLIHLVDIISEQESAYLASYGLSKGRFVVLMLCAKAEEPLKSSELADLAAVSKATMTGLLDALERDDMIERVTSTKDRRIIYVHLRPKGQDLLKRVLPGYFQCISKMIAVLKEKERKQTVLLLKKIKDNVLPEPPSLEAPSSKVKVA